MSHQKKLLDALERRIEARIRELLNNRLSGIDELQDRVSLKPGEQPQGHVLKALEYKKFASGAARIHAPRVGNDANGMRGVHFTIRAS